MFNSEFNLQYLIWIIAFLPVVGSSFLIFINNTLTVKRLGLTFSFLTFFLSLFLWIFFDKSYSRFQFVSELSWSPLANLNFSLGVDGISLFFVILTTLLFPLCLLMSWNSVTKKVKEYVISFLVMETLLILVFSVRDLLLFYIFFESVLIQMFVIIGVWGSRDR